MVGCFAVMMVVGGLVYGRVVVGGWRVMIGDGLMIVDRLTVGGWLVDNCGLVMVVVG